MNDTRQLKDDRQQKAVLEAEVAINEEVKRFNLEYAELSITIRELLGKVYIRGGMDALQRIKIANVQQNNQNQ